MLDCSTLHPTQLLAAVLASEADSVHRVVKAMSVNMPSLFVLNLCILLGQTKTLCVFFDITHWAFLARLLHLVSSTSVVIQVLIYVSVILMFCVPKRFQSTFLNHQTAK